MIQNDENIGYFVAVLSLLINTYDEDGCKSVPISKLRALMDHYDIQ